MNRKQYPSDLTDEQWQIVRKLLPKPSKRGRKPLDRREVLNALLYVNRTGCQWRALPHDLPNWKSVYTVFWRWRQQGLWQQIHDALRHKVRRQAGKRKEPTAAVIDSQSVKTTEVADEERGYDAAKKVSGRKRNIAVDTLGLVLAVVVSGAYWQDYDAAGFVFNRLRKTCKKLKVIFGDSAYGKAGLVEWVRKVFGWILQPVLRPVDVRGFVVLPKRWVVERTFAWLGRYRRHSKDYERSTQSSEAMIYLSMIQLMARRLAKNS